MLKVDEYLRGNYISAKLTNNGKAALGSIFRFELKVGESKTIEEMGVSKEKFDSVVSNQLRYLIDEKKTLKLVGIKNELVEKTEDGLLDEIVKPTDEPVLDSIKGLSVSAVRMDEIQELPNTIEVEITKTVETLNSDVPLEVIQPEIVLDSTIDAVAVEDKKKKGGKKNKEVVLESVPTEEIVTPPSFENKEI